MGQRCNGSTADPRAQQRRGALFNGAISEPVAAAAGIVGAVSSPVATVVEPEGRFVAASVAPFTAPRSLGNDTRIVRAFSVALDHASVSDTAIAIGRASGCEHRADDNANENEIARRWRRLTPAGGDQGGLRARLRP